MGTTTLMKPDWLSLTQWCRREKNGGDTLKFIQALCGPEAEKKYVFEELEGADFTTHAHVGTRNTLESQCLYCMEMNVEVVANALTFQKCTKLRFPSLNFRIQLMCHSKGWNNLM